MRITTVQAADKLKVGGSVIRRLIAEGVIKDYKPHKDGAQKHFSILDSVEVNALAKVYRPRMTSDTVKKLLLNGNGNHAEPPVRVLTPPVAKSPVEGVLSRLDRIESLLQKLVGMWS